MDISVVAAAHSLVIGLIAGLGLCVLVSAVLLGLLLRRSSQHADARVSSVVHGLEGRMEELATELADAVRRAEEETHRSRCLMQSSSTMDLDDVLTATLEAAMSSPRIDAALVQLEADPDEQPLVAETGFEGERPDAIALFGSPEGWGARAVEVSFRYAEDTGAGTVQRALGVPLVDRDARIGWLAVFSRESETRLSDADVRRLEELAERVAPTIQNARRFREARELADFDALTGLHNRRYFHETLEREVARTHRYGRQLALVLTDVDGFKEINDRIGHLAGDAVLAEMAERVSQVVRTADVPCRVGGDEFAVIVPEAGLDDAQRLVLRIQQAVTSQPIARAGWVRVSAGIAELQPNDDATSLFERADGSLYAAKHARSSGGLAAAE
jgi:diguanylate cyclase (GGDEF)-like protein